MVSTLDASASLVASDPDVKPTKIKKKLKFPHLLPKSKKWLLLLLLPLFLIIALGAASAYPLLKIKALVPKSEADARGVYDALKHQDLVGAKTKLADTKNDLAEVNRYYQYLSWAKFSPFFQYYNDGTHLITAAGAGLDAGDILISSVEPYADVLGFTGEGTFTGGTAEERIVKILETLDKVAPSLDQVAGKMQAVQSELNQINPKRYPFEVRGKSVEELLTMAQKYSDAAVVAVTQVKPLLTQLPNVAGLSEEKKYLVLFQNDAELRPTGGFLTAYAVLRVDKGRVYPENNDDIYSLDAKFTKKLEPPAPIKKYLNVFYWNLRDMNWSPDFKTSMDTFLEYYQGIPGEAKKLDGVIAVDTQVLSDLIKVLGPIEVPGFGKFTSETDEHCNCPQVIWQLENMASKPVAHVRNDRKAFLGPMMQTLLLQAYGSPKAVWPGLFQTGIQSVIDKHVLFYMFDPDAQAAIEQVNIGGRIRDFDSDYFMVVDANLGGAKQNLFITEDIAMDITPSENEVTHEVTLTYDNPAPWSNCNLEAGELCLNGRYIDYVRIYLPSGSKLVDALGFDEDTVTTSEDLGKTVIEGVFKFDPESRAKLKLSYTTPKFSDSPYQIMVQKQAGKKTPKYTVTYNNEFKEEFDLATDKIVKFE